MYKSATTPGKDNLMRPDNDDYMSKGYVPMESQYDNSVSHALEYYVADYALSTLAEALGKKKMRNCSATFWRAIKIIIASISEPCVR